MYRTTLCNCPVHYWLLYLSKPGDILWKFTLNLRESGSRLSLKIIYQNFLWPVPRCEHPKRAIFWMGLWKIWLTIIECILDRLNLQKETFINNVTNSGKIFGTFFVFFEYRQATWHSHLDQTQNIGCFDYDVDLRHWV